jgi:prepilin-type N-terminal cleavage/methylation domain-containing protein
MVRRAERLLPRLRAGEDTGFTLVELVVAMAIFSIFITVAISSVVGITRASSRVQVTAMSSSQELVVFQRLDRQIRYASSINFPGAGPSGNRYVEFRTPADSAIGKVTLCTQWRFNVLTRSIQSRQWNDVVGSTATNWETELGNVADDGGSTYPFKLKPATNLGSAMQQLVLTLDTGNAAIKGAAISTTFVARNSSLQNSTSPSNADTLTAGVSDTPICTTEPRQ